MNILVAGGAGFIGTNFIHLLLCETMHTVVNFDWLTYAGNRQHSARFEGKGRYQFVEGDIADRPAVEATLSDRSIDAIVNFAAESHVDRSISDASPFLHANIVGTQVLLDVARARGIERFVQVSTDEVYGDLAANDPPFTELSPLRPSSPYAASKAAADLLALATFRTHRQPIIITRCSNNYGPYQYPEKFIPLAIERAKKNQTIPVYGDGLNVRDWIFVEDHCRGVLEALTRGRDGEVYNFGGQAERRNIDIAETIVGLLEKPKKLIEFVTDRPGHDRRYAINFEKAAAEFQWQPTVSFETGLARTVAWYTEGHRGD